MENAGFIMPCVQEVLTHKVFAVDTNIFIA